MAPPFSKSLADDTQSIFFTQSSQRQITSKQLSWLLCKYTSPSQRETFWSSSLVRKKLSQPRKCFNREQEVWELKSRSFWSSRFTLLCHLIYKRKSLFLVHRTQGRSFWQPISQKPPWQLMELSMWLTVGSRSKQATTPGQVWRAWLSLLLVRLQQTKEQVEPVV